MGCSLAEQSGEAGPRIIKYYADRARGGAGLIQACVDNAKVPCIQTGTGICHVYIDDSADITMALDIIENAKTSRPSVCNAAEVCLVHRDIAPRFLPLLKIHL